MELATLTTGKTAVEERNLYTFQSNIQEGLSLDEIIFHLQPKSTSNLSKKRKMLRDIVSARANVFKAFSNASKKLGSSFLCCLPRKAEMAEKSKSLTSYKDAIVRTIFKLAILFDVYTTIQGHNLEPIIEKLFQPLLTEVARAKELARQQRDKIKVNNRVKTIIDGIMKASLAESGLVAAGKDARARDSPFANVNVEAKRRAVSRCHGLRDLPSLNC